MISPLERFTILIGCIALAALNLFGASIQPSLASDFGKQLMLLAGILIAIALWIGWPILTATKENPWPPRRKS